MARRKLALGVLALCLLAGTAHAWTKDCGASTETHKVKVPKGCDYTKKDKCLLDDINSNEIVVKFKSGDNNGIIEFNLDTLDNTDGGSKTQWTAVQFPGDKSQWPPKAGVDLCNDATGTGKKFRGIIDKSQWKCGLKFLVCVKPEKNPWSYANTGCCFTVKVDPLPGSVCQDPHFVAFSGEKFDFHGEDNKVFSIVSSPAFQLNALFSPANVVDGQTFMTEMGIMTAQGDRIHVMAADFAKLAVKLTGGHMMALPADSMISLDSGMTLTMVPAGLGSGETLTITTSDLRVQIYSPAWDQDGGDGVIAVHLNLAVEVLNEGITLHGVLGQTYAPGANVATSITDDNNKGGSEYADYHTRIEGSMEDYLVSGLFQCDARFCKFVPADDIALPGDESDSAFPETSADVTADSRRKLQEPEAADVDYTTESTVIYSQPIAETAEDAPANRRMLQDGSVDYTTDSTVIYADIPTEESSDDTILPTEESSDDTTPPTEESSDDTTPQRHRRMLQDDGGADYTTDSTVIYADFPTEESIADSTPERRLLQDGGADYTTDSTVIYADLPTEEASDDSNAERRLLQEDADYSTESTVVYSEAFADTSEATSETTSEATSEASSEANSENTSETNSEATSDTTEEATSERRRLQDGEVNVDYTTESVVIYSTPVELSSSTEDSAATSPQNRRMLR